MQKTQAEIIQAIWNNPEEHQAFFANPKQYLLEQGQEISENTEVLVCEDTLSLRHFILPTAGTQLPEGDDPLLQITRQAMEDSEFKAQLLENPKIVAQEMGIAIPEGLEIKVLENQPNAMNVIVPFNPACRELSDADLEAVAGGKSNRTNARICGGTGGGILIACGVGAIFSLGTAAPASAVAGTVIGSASAAASS